MDSRTYWRKREERWIKENIKHDKEIAKEIEALLNDAYDDIQKDIDSFYAKYSNKEGISIAEARKRVAQHDVQKFQSAAKKYVDAKDFSQRANEELRLYNLTMKVNRLELLKAQINMRLTGASDDIDNLLADNAYEQSIEEIRRNAGILADSTNIDIEDRARKILNGSFHLSDSNVLNTFSDNIWLYKTELVNDLEKLLIRSFTKGENPRVMAKQLKKQFNVYGYQAERLARTEMSKIYSTIQHQSYVDNEIDEYELIAEPTACDTCATLDGKIFKVKDMLAGKNASPLHPNCKCSTAPYVKSNKIYDDWLERGIIDKEEYESLQAFRKDYDTKFEALMKRRNEYEQSMQSKRKKRRLR